MGDVQAQNARGKWVPSIPLPFYGLRKRCTCGRKFWTMDGYRSHYALAHILYLGGAGRVTWEPVDHIHEAVKRMMEGRRSAATGGTDAP